MRKSLLFLVLLLLLAVPSAAPAGDARDITVVNKTGEVIQSLFISPVDTEKWEEDVLGLDVLADGESVEISFSGYAADECAFDVLATNEDGDQWLLPDVDLCEVLTVTITSKYIKAD